MPAIDSGFFFRMQGHVGPHSAETELWYGSQDPFPTGNPQVMVQHLIAQIWTGALKALVSENFVLDTCTGHFFNNPGGSSGEYTEYVNEPGDVTDESLPAWNTVNITKVPNPATGDPDTNTWKNGFVGFSGVPEISQVNGYLTDSALAAWADVAAAILTTTYPSGSMPVYSLGLYRFDGEYPDGSPKPPAGKVAVVNTWVKQRLGTRNSRKKI